MMGANRVKKSGVCALRPVNNVAYGWETGNDMNCPFKVFVRAGLVDAWQGGGAETAGRAVRPSTTCLEAARAKQHARHITATSSSHMVSRSLQTFVHHNNASPKISLLAPTKTFVF